MRIVLAGRRTVFEPGARAYDLEAPPELEFTRKVRTLAGNFQLLELLPALLDPRRNPVFVQFVSHKLGRLLVPHLLVLLFVANLFLLDGVYLVFFAGQCLWYLLATVGALVSRPAAQSARHAAPVQSFLRERPSLMMRFLLIPYEFVLLNWAAMRALFCFLSRRGLAEPVDRRRRARQPAWRAAH